MAENSAKAALAMYPDRLSTMGKSPWGPNYPKYTLVSTDRQRWWFFFSWQKAEFMQTTNMSGNFWGLENASHAHPLTSNHTQRLAQLGYDPKILQWPKWPKYICTSRWNWRWMHQLRREKDGKRRLWSITRRSKNSIFRSFKVVVWFITSDAWLLYWLWTPRFWRSISFRWIATWRTSPACTCQVYNSYSQFCID